jgi:hypothetical protein
MRRTILLICLTLGAIMASAAVLWDNYQGPKGFDEIGGFSSERNPIIKDSWTVDDALLSHPVRVDQIRWIGWFSKASTHDELTDVIVLRPNQQGGLETIAEWRDLKYNYRIFLLYEFLDPYEGTVQLPPGGIELPPGHYYFGTRLATTRYGWRNFAATAGLGNLKGLTEAYFKSPDYGYPEWTRVSQTKGGYSTDVAFRLDGEIIPEPAPLLALVIAAALRRR